MRCLLPGCGAPGRYLCPSHLRAAKAGEDALSQGRPLVERASLFAAAADGTVLAVLPALGLRRLAEHIGDRAPAAPATSTVPVEVPVRVCGRCGSRTRSAAPCACAPTASAETPTLCRYAPHAEQGRRATQAGLCSTCAKALLWAARKWNSGHGTHPVTGSLAHLLLVELASEPEALAALERSWGKPLRGALAEIQRDMARAPTPCRHPEHSGRLAVANGLCVACFDSITATIRSYRMRKTLPRSSTASAVLLRALPDDVVEEIIAAREHGEVLREIRAALLADPAAAAPTPAAPPPTEEYSAMANACAYPEHDYLQAVAKGFCSECAIVVATALQAHIKGRALPAETSVARAVFLGLPVDQVERLSSFWSPQQGASFRRIHAQLLALSPPAPAAPTGDAPVDDGGVPLADDDGPAALPPAKTAPAPSPKRACPVHPERPTVAGGLCGACGAGLLNVAKRKGRVPAIGTAARRALAAAEETWIARHPHLVQLRAELEGARSPTTTATGTPTATSTKAEAFGADDSAPTATTSLREPCTVEGSTAVAANSDGNNDTGVLLTTTATAAAEEESPSTTATTPTDDPAADTDGDGYGDDTRTATTPGYVVQRLPHGRLIITSEGYDPENPGPLDVPLSDDRDTDADTDIDCDEDLVEDLDGAGDDFDPDEFFQLCGDCDDANPDADADADVDIDGDAVYASGTPEVPGHTWGADGLCTSEDCYAGRSTDEKAPHPLDFEDRLQPCGHFWRELVSGGVDGDSRCGACLDDESLANRSLRDESLSNDALDADENRVNLRPGGNPPAAADVLEDEDLLQQLEEEERALSARLEAVRRRQAIVSAQRSLDALPPQISELLPDDVPPLVRSDLAERLENALGRWWEEMIGRLRQIARDEHKEAAK